MKTLISLLILCGSAAAQLPDTPSKFWTKERIIVTSALAAESAYDGWTTQKAMSDGNHYEANPFARPLVNRGASGQVAASVLGVGAILGIQYAFHRAHHEKLANWTGRIALSLETVNIGRQSYVVHGLK